MSESENVDVQREILGEKIEIVAITVDVLKDRLDMIDRKLVALQAFLDETEEPEDD